MPIVDLLLFLPSMCASIKNRLFVVMELFQRYLYFYASMFINHGRLGKVSDVHQGANGNNKGIRYCTGNDAYDVSLDVSVILSHCFLEF